MPLPRPLPRRRPLPGSRPARPAGSPARVAALALAGAAVLASGGPASDAPAIAHRVVSLNPSLTETLVALGARDSLVGVDDYSARVRPEVAGLPTVGGLFDPSLEAIVALDPDLVALVPSAQQRGLRARLDALGVEVLALPNITLGEVLGSLEALGVRVGRAEAARQRIAAIRGAWDEVGRATASLPAARAVLVLQRDPLYVVGPGSFLDDMLRAAGLSNAASELEEAYARVGAEWLIRTAPDVILDATGDAVDPAAYYARWPSLPAVAAGRTIAVPPSAILPGPHLDRSLREIARAVRGAEAPADADPKPPIAPDPEAPPPGHTGPGAAP